LQLESKWNEANVLKFELIKGSINTN